MLLSRNISHLGAKIKKKKCSFLCAKVEETLISKNITCHKSSFELEDMLREILDLLFEVQDPKYVRLFPSNARSSTSIFA